jgi:hypothetical protein
MNNLECKNIFEILFTPEQYSERHKESTIVVCSSDKIFALNRFHATPEFFVILIIDNTFVTKDRLLNFHPISIFFMTSKTQSFYPKGKDGSRVGNAYISMVIIKGVGAAVLG